MPNLHAYATVRAATLLGSLEWYSRSKSGLYIANFECRDSRLICKIFGGQSPPLSPFL
jgi:hypothetical protein